MKRKPVYKLFRLEDGNRTSITSCWGVLNYPKGETVTAPKGTPGIFCYKTKEQALSSGYSFSGVLEVEPIGRKSYKSEYCYKEKGHVCYPAVRVLT